MKRDQKSSVTREKILETAIDLFYQVGFVKASIRDIAKKVGIAKSSVYVHFKKKDDILFQIITDLTDYALRELRKAAGMHDNPLDSLKAMMLCRQKVSFCLRGSASK